MIHLIAQVGKDVSLVGGGAAGITVLGVIGLLVKRGITGTFSIGGGGGKNKDFVTNDQCALRVAETKADADKRQNRTEVALDKLVDKIDNGFESVHKRIDGLYDRNARV